MIPKSSDIRNMDDATREIILLNETVAQLRYRIDQQAVLLRAFFALVCEQGTISEAELLDRFRMIALAKSGAPAERCAKCGRTISLRYNRCYYCGEPQKVRSAFELLDSGVWPDVPLKPASHDPALSDERIMPKPPPETGIVDLNDD